MIIFCKEIILNTVLGVNSLLIVAKRNIWNNYVKRTISTINLIQHSIEIKTKDYHAKKSIFFMREWCTQICTINKALRLKVNKN